MKKSRQNSIDKLTSELNKLNVNPQQQGGADNRFWKPEVDKSGNGYAVIRFLPAPQGEDVPFVRVWDHGFQGPTGKWFIEKSLTTIGQKDPVSEYNTMLWNSGIESNKELVRKYKRRLSFYSNIYVVKDPSNPQNDGQVFLFKYGKKIFDKLNDMMNPEFEDESPRNPFDMWEGADFKLKIRNVEGYRNYDKSEFAAPSAIMDNDEALEKLWKTQHSINEFIAPDNFKSYDELKQKLYSVLALDNPQAESEVVAPVAPAPIAATAAAATIQETDIASSFTPSSDADDESLSFFQKLAEN
tara:strand:- start:5573 stop:6469 length:897 start_codon:yes stop_codon:yes gene_type:complete